MLSEIKAVYKFDFFLSYHSGWNLSDAFRKRFPTLFTCSNDSLLSFL